MNNIIEDIQNKFETCVKNNCIETISDEKFFVIEDSSTNKSSLIKKDTSKGDYSEFEIENINKKDIHFLAIDNCIFDDSSDHKKCDFSIFDETTFCFVEMKTNATSLKDQARKKNKKTAILQLKETVKIFKEKIDFSKYEYSIEAIICPKYEELRPVATTNFQSAQLEFQKELNTILLNGNQKKF